MTQSLPHLHGYAMEAYTDEFLALGIPDDGTCRVVISSASADEKVSHPNVRFDASILRVLSQLFSKGFRYRNSQTLPR